jgi:hypothetical protein
MRPWVGLAGVQEIGEKQAGPPDAPAAAARAGTRSVCDELAGYMEELERRAPRGSAAPLTNFTETGQGGLRALQAAGGDPAARGRDELT